VLASAGVASRRECEELITEGRVQVDGEIVTELGVRVDREAQEIKVDGEVLKRPRLSYYALHKPTGVVTTARDPAGRPRVIDLLPPTIGRVFPVGRLDLESEGLILLTNDGELANQLTHPKHGVEKTYDVQVAGHMDPEILQQLRRGVYLSEGYAHAVHARIKSKIKNSTLLEMVLDEGRNREVRRLLARVGHKVQRLTRVAVGPVRLGDLPRGAYRQLTQDEVRKLREAAAAGPKPKPERDNDAGPRKPIGKRPPGKPAFGRKPVAGKGPFGKGPGAKGSGGKPMGRKPLGSKPLASKPGTRKPPGKPFVGKATAEAPEFQRRVLGAGDAVEGETTAATASDVRPAGGRSTGGKPAYGGKPRYGKPGAGGRPGRPGGKPPAGKPRFRKSAEGGAAGGGKFAGRKPKPLKRRPPRPGGGSKAT
jgi:23S rRNA pseudouridine2605 synthase